jgi:hypothetical protein
LLIAQIVANTRITTRVSRIYWYGSLAIAGTFPTQTQLIKVCTVQIHRLPGGSPRVDTFRRIQIALLADLSTGPSCAAITLTGIRLVAAKFCRVCSQQKIEIKIGKSKVDCIVASLLLALRRKSSRHPTDGVKCVRRFVSFDDKAV